MALASSSSSSSSSLAAIVGVATAVSTLSLLTFGFVLGSVVFVEDKVVVYLRIDVVIYTLLAIATIATLPWIKHLLNPTSSQPPITLNTTTVAIIPPNKPPTSTSTNVKKAVAAAIPTENPYAHLKPSLTSAFLEAADLTLNPADGTVWASVLNQGTDGGFKIEVHRKVGTDFCFRVIADMEGSPEEVFDILSDITTRKDWDEVCEGGGVVQVLGPDSKVQFMLSKGFWPTAPRDALVVGFIKRLEDGRYLNVTQSVDNAPGFVPRPGSVRMQAKLAGQIVGPHPSGKERMCRVVQIMDGDLGGWLPKSLVAMLTTQAMPLSLRRVNKMLKKKATHRTSSELVEEAEGKRAIAEVAPPASSEHANGTVVTNGVANGAANGAAPVASFVVGGVDVAPTVETVRKALVVAQPWLVALVFLTVIRRGRTKA